MFFIYSEKCIIYIVNSVVELFWLKHFYLVLRNIRSYNLKKSNLLPLEILSICISFSFRFLKRAFSSISHFSKGSDHNEIWINSYFDFSFAKIVCIIWRFFKHRILNTLPIISGSCLSDTWNFLSYIFPNVII